MLQCPTCDRKFNPIPYEKHIRICEKVFVAKRKKFDSKEMRVAALVEENGADAAKLLKDAEKKQKKGAKGGAKKSAEEAPVGGGDKKSKWKEQSKAFREAMRAARDVTVAIATGAPLPPPVISAPDSSLIPCPHCNRRFNEKAAERHIPQCQNIKAKPSSLSKGSGGSAVASNLKKSGFESIGAKGGGGGGGGIGAPAAAGGGGRKKY